MEENKIEQKRTEKSKIEENGVEQSKVEHNRVEPPTDYKIPVHSVYDVGSLCSL